MQRKQKQIWEKEHATALMLPNEMSKHSSESPSSNVVRFVSYLQMHSIVPPARMLDIGCGKGRNALYLAQLGYKVYGFDYVTSAIRHVQAESKRKMLTSNLEVQVGEMDSVWKYNDNYFDAIIDNYSSIDIETLEGRQVYKNELYRTLKPGGYAMVTVVSADDELEKEMIEKYPGAEKNSCIWPDTGKFQKDYDEEEIREFYKNFKIIEINKLKKHAHKLQRKYLATDYLIIIQKLTLE